MEPVDVRVRRQKCGWIGHTLRKDEKYIARKAMDWNPFISARWLPGRPRGTWRRTVARNSKIIRKSWNEWKAFADNRTRLKTGVIDSVCPPWEETANIYIYV